MDAKALGASLNLNMKCWETLLPHVVRHPLLRVDLMPLLKAYQRQYPGAMYSGCGGGYLIVVSNEPVPGAFQVNVRYAKKIMKASNQILTVLLLGLTLAAASAQTNPATLMKLPPIAEGPFKPDWNSLTNYQTPEWFRDAKFGIWAHWGPQCEPEHGDWYARNMYMEGSADYKSHLAEYGHPSTNGFKDVIHVMEGGEFRSRQAADILQGRTARNISWRSPTITTTSTTSIPNISRGIPSPSGRTRI